VGAHAPSALLEASRHVAPHDVPRLVAEYAEGLGAREATIFLADLQQVVLTPFPGPGGAGVDHRPSSLPIDSTLAGRAYQHGEVTTQGPQDDGSGATTLWLPLRAGAHRLGVLAVTVEGLPDSGPDAGLLAALDRFAAVVAELVVLKTAYGDSMVTARRTAEIGLAAEIQWGLLPPLSFSCPEVTIAGSLEPAYEVAGDSVDYAVDPEVARVGIFDGMGHGLRSAQLAALAVAAYRNCRRSGRTLVATAVALDEAVEAAFLGDSYTTAVLAELQTTTGQLTWVNAGHPEPLLLRRGQLVRELHVDPGLPFGLGLSHVEHAYAVGSEQLQPGDRVLLHTDGVVEAHSPAGDLFGLERLVDLLARNVADNLSAAESMRRVSRALLEHQQAYLTDDATMLLLEWPGGAR
jgi:hypothetical protein